MNIGDKVKFEGETHRYTVQAFDDNFVILTKPFNARKTFLYTIVDRRRNVRGPCNLIFGMPDKLDNPLIAAQSLGELQRGEMEVSHRYCIPIYQSELDQMRIYE